MVNEHINFKEVHILDDSVKNFEQTIFCPKEHNKLFHSLSLSYIDGYTFDNCVFNSISFYMVCFNNTTFNNCTFNQCYFKGNTIIDTFFKNCVFKNGRVLLNLDRNEEGYFDKCNFKGTYIRANFVQLYQNNTRV